MLDLFLFLILASGTSERNWASEVLSLLQLMIIAFRQDERGVLLQLLYHKMAFFVLYFSIHYPYSRGASIHSFLHLYFAVDLIKESFNLWTCIRLQNDVKAMYSLTPILVESSPPIFLNVLPSDILKKTTPKSSESWQIFQCK